MTISLGRPGNGEIFPWTPSGHHPTGLVVTSEDASNVHPCAESVTMTTQPDQPLNAEDQEIIDALERSRGRPLTKEEVRLSLEQARALGEIADSVVPTKRGVA